MVYQSQSTKLSTRQSKYATKKKIGILQNRPRKNTFCWPNLKKNCTRLLVTFYLIRLLLKNINFRKKIWFFLIKITSAHSGNAARRKSWILKSLNKIERDLVSTPIPYIRVHLTLRCLLRCRILLFDSSCLIVG